MYFNKERTNDQLENGVDNGADLGEDLYNFIERIFACSNMEEIKTLQDVWEGKQ